MSKDFENVFEPHYIAGIESYGPADCKNENILKVYTRVTEYLEWIVDNIRD
jgi:secreted trypsin-like serine protease